MTSTFIINALDMMKTEITGGICASSSYSAACSLVTNAVSNCSSLVSSQQITPTLSTCSLKKIDYSLETTHSNGKKFNTNRSSSSNFKIDLRSVFCLKNNECQSLVLNPSIYGSSYFIDVNDIKQTIEDSFLIFLDCRTIADFNSKHIKDSVHLNVRDKITKKRLQSQKITIKDLISCERIKNKLGLTYQNANKNVVRSCIVLYDETTSDLKDLLTDSNPLRIVKDNIEQSGYQQECKILKGS